MNIQSFAHDNLERLIQLAIDEDVAGGDLATMAITPAHQTAKAILHTKKDGVISGIEIARMVLDHFGANDFRPLVKDGDEPG